MKIHGYFNVEHRNREKQESRERIERDIAEGKAPKDYGLFSALDPSKARIVERRVKWPPKKTGPPD